MPDEAIGLQAEDTTGHHAIVIPIPHGIPSALKGSRAGPGPSSEQARDAERRAEGSGLLAQLIDAENGFVHRLPDSRPNAAPGLG